MNKLGSSLRGMMASGLVVAVVVGNLVAQDRELEGEQRQEVVFGCDFESDRWYRQWAEDEAPARTTLVASDSERRFEPRQGKALRIRVDQGGHNGISLAYRFQERTGSEPEEIYFRYDLRFADDWNPARGGKLPGIAGTYGEAGWGGRPASGSDGWSARGLFAGQRDGRTPTGFTAITPTCVGAMARTGCGTSRRDWRTTVGIRFSSTSG